MPDIQGDIWADGDGQFIVAHDGEIIVLVPEELEEPTGVWAEETGLSYETWEEEGL